MASSTRCPGGTSCSPYRPTAAHACVCAAYVRLPARVSYCGCRRNHDCSEHDMAWSYRRAAVFAAQSGSLLLVFEELQCSAGACGSPAALRAFASCKSMGTTAAQQPQLEADGRVRDAPHGWGPPAAEAHEPGRREETEVALPVRRLAAAHTGAAASYPLY